MLPLIRVGRVLLTKQEESGGSEQEGARKALRHERFLDWKEKLDSLGLKCKELTGNLS